MDHTDAADRKQAQAVVDHYTKLAPAYDTRWDLYSRNSLGKLAEHLRLVGGEHMLDVACGTGRLAALLRRTHPSLRVTGVDISPDMLRVARQRLPQDERTTWHLGTLETVELARGSFDLVTCNNAFHLMPDQPGVLARMVHLARPGGAIAVVDWCREYPQIAALQLLAPLLDHQYRNILTGAQLGALLEGAGLDLECSARFMATRFWGMMCMVARKPAAA